MHLFAFTPEAPTALMTVVLSLACPLPSSWVWCPSGRMISG